MHRIEQIIQRGVRQKVIVCQLLSNETQKSRCTNLSYTPRRVKKKLMFAYIVWRKAKAATIGHVIKNVKETPVDCYHRSFGVGLPLNRVGMRILFCPSLTSILKIKCNVSIPCSFQSTTLCPLLVLLQFFSLYRRIRLRLL